MKRGRTPKRKRAQVKRGMPLDTAQSLEIQRVMQSEVRRAMRGLRLDEHPAPFFISHLLHAVEGVNISARYGSLFHSQPFHECDLYSEVHVGSYDFDQTIDGGLTNELSERESYNWIEGPQDLSPDAVRYCFWKLTQHKYEEALQEYYDKKKILVEQHLREQNPSFSRENRQVRNHEVKPVRFPRRAWEDLVREMSELFRDHKRLVDPYVRIRGVNCVRIFVNSEGSAAICQETYYELAVKAWHLTGDGTYLNSSRLFYVRKRSELPPKDVIAEAVDELARDLDELARSPVLEPYAGPALLSGLASGLIFHEAIGHRLEGERMTSRFEGQTFAGKVGQRILPQGIDVVDDPSVASWDKRSLYGHYLVDDEGVPAQPVTLVEDGVLKSFLMSRSCIEGFAQSNGHGRHERYQDPMARMANLIVQSRDGRPWDELYEMLLTEVVGRGMPYGILIEGVEGGETRTDHYDFQAFKGTPTAVYTVNPRNGKQKRVRNMSFIGTPLAVIQRILAFGDECAVDNSYCWAESGAVPVSTVAPPMLVGDLELQKGSQRLYRKPILKFPPMQS